MEDQEGLTSEQAIKLIELGRIAKKQPVVKTVDKSLRSKPGRAFLVEVLNNNRANVKPFKHGGKIETMDLSQLRFWKGGCAFSIEEAQNLNHLSTATLIEAKGQAISSLSKKISYVIFSAKAKGFWRENNRTWTTNLNTVSKWTERDLAERVKTRLANSPMTDDAILMDEMEARNRYSELIVAQEATLKAPMQKATLHAPVVHSAPPVQHAASSAPSKTDSGNLLEDDDFLDYSAFMKADDTALRKAEEARRAAAENYNIAKKAWLSALTLLQSEDSKVVALGGRTWMKEKTERSPRKPGSKRNKKNNVREAIRTVLRTCPSATPDYIFSHLPSGIETTLDKLKHCLLGLRNSGQAERDQNGQWALTAAGREA